ncbi:MAG TPA: alpha/beta hydrolase [Acidobacteriaceae bacterium]|nr:alpha/beta hydrolase [Acidobacteriaceae bacterium]
MKFAHLISSTVLLSLVAASMHAQTRNPKTAPPPEHQPSGFAKTTPLWPGPAPLAKGTAPADLPKLFYYPPEGSGVGSAVIVLPGGGYTDLVFEKEGAVEARWLAAHGIAAFVLQYRLGPRYKYPVPMLDGARAVRYVRSHAANYALDPDKIGVWGFSAGGNLAGYLATEPFDRDKSSTDPVERVSAHPDFAIFSYARFSMDESIPRSTNMEAILGAHPSPEMLDSISYARHVTRDTSPSFIYATTADQTVNSLNSTAYYDALKHSGVPAELHIFELGYHGTGMGQHLKGLSELEVWPTLLENWMLLHGWMSPTAPE